MATACHQLKGFWGWLGYTKSPPWGWWPGAQALPPPFAGAEAFVEARRGQGPETWLPNPPWC